MRKLIRHVARIVTVLLLGGFLGATLVRLAPGLTVDEQELDSRLNHESIQALRQARAIDDSLPSFYFRYLNRLVHGDLGTSRTLQQPVRQLLAERLPETLKSVGLGLALGWTLGLALAIATVMSRSWYVDLVSSLLAGVLLCIPAAVLALLFVISRAPGRLVLGLGGFRILLWHILPVAAPQLLALAGVSVSLAFAAAIPVEVLCDLPGIGQLAWKAALGRDLELLVNIMMMVTLITLVANSTSELVEHSARTGTA